MATIEGTRLTWWLQGDVISIVRQPAIIGLGISVASYSLWNRNDNLDIWQSVALLMALK